MRPLAVVLLAPDGKSTPEVVECSEPGCVEALVAQSAVEARLLERQAPAVFSDHALQRFAMQT